MSLTHKHLWKEVARTYNESLLERVAKSGATSIKTGGYASQEAKDRDSHGFTNIELQCPACGDVKVVTAVGRVSSGEDQRS